MIIKKSVPSGEDAMKLLYAEDERQLSEAVVDILTYHKYLVDAVDNGRDAYDYELFERRSW